MTVQTVDVAALLAELAPETETPSKGGSKPTRTIDREATREEEALAAELQSARASAKAWQEYSKRVQDGLYRLMGQARTLSRPGGGKIQQIDNAPSERLDVKRLRADHPELRDILDQYTTTTEAGSYLRVSG